MLIDHAIIEIAAGHGGNGKVSFRREKYVPKGGPDGGDGGNGGSIFLLASSSVDTLLDFAGRHHWKAGDGEPGGIKQCTGKQGDDLTIKVPLGTLIYDDTTGDLLIDLATENQLFTAAQGGRGGRGNEHFKTSTNQAPREAEPGQPGEERRLRLELKLIADIGIIGKPNAGKSTLLAKISRAHPKIADYPFTTLEPQLGIAEISSQRRIVFADIPGLIQGASQGTGLGFRFLRHIERTRLLLHLLEIEPSDGSNPVENYRMIRQELANYSPELAQRREIIVLTKTDLLLTPEDIQAAIELISPHLPNKPLTISAATGHGITTLLETCWKHLHPQT